MNVSYIFGWSTEIVVLAALSICQPAMRIYVLYVRINQRGRGILKMSLISFGRISFSGGGTVCAATCVVCPV